MLTKSQEIKALLAEVRARADAATPGPWEDHNWDVMEKPHVVVPKLWDGKSSCNGSFDVPCTPENASFIGHARTDVPRLVRALEAAVGALDFHEGTCVTADGQRTSATIALAQVADALGGKRE